MKEYRKKQLVGLLLALFSFGVFPGLSFDVSHVLAAQDMETMPDCENSDECPSPAQECIKHCLSSIDTKRSEPALNAPSVQLEILVPKIDSLFFVSDIFLNTGHPNDAPRGDPNILLTTQKRE